MGAYEALAASYDRLTNDVDYGATVDFYFEILEKERCSRGLPQIWPAGRAP